MEPKMIAKKCVMDEKEAKKMIYRLLADGILQIQDISATGNLSQAKYSIYLFHSDQLQLGKLFRKKNLLGKKSTNYFCHNNINSPKKYGCEVECGIWESEIIIGQTSEIWKTVTRATWGKKYERPDR